MARLVFGVLVLENIYSLLGPRLCLGPLFPEALLPFRGCAEGAWKRSFRKVPSQAEPGTE